MHLLCHLNRFVIVGCVAGYEGGTRLKGLQFGKQRAAIVIFLQIGENHSGTVLCKELCGALTDAARGTSNKGYLIL